MERMNGNLLQLQQLQSGRCELWHMKEEPKLIVLLSRTVGHEADPKMIERRWQEPLPWRDCQVGGPPLQVITRASEVNLWVVQFVPCMQVGTLVRTIFQFNKTKSWPLQAGCAYTLYAYMVAHAIAEGKAFTRCHGTLQTIFYWQIREIFCCFNKT